MHDYYFVIEVRPYDGVPNFQPPFNVNETPDFDNTDNFVITRHVVRVLPQPPPP